MGSQPRWQLAATAQCASRLPPETQQFRILGRGASILVVVRCYEHREDAHAALRSALVGSLRPAPREPRKGASVGRGFRCSTAGQDQGRQPAVVVRGPTTQSPVATARRSWLADLIRVPRLLP